MLWASALGKMIFDREDPLSNGGHEAGDLQISELWFMQERSFSHSLGIPHKCSRCRAWVLTVGQPGSPPVWVLGGHVGLHATLGGGAVELCAVVMTALRASPSEAL